MLVNDDFTPREFVVLVLKAEFRLNEGQASRVMMTAHQRGICVVAVFTKEVAEAKATDMARKKQYPLLFTTEPEEQSSCRMQLAKPWLSDAHSCAQECCSLIKSGSRSALYARPIGHFSFAATRACCNQVEMSVRLQSRKVRGRACGAVGGACQAPDNLLYQPP